MYLYELTSVRIIFKEEKGYKRKEENRHNLQVRKEGRTRLSFPVRS